MSLRDPSDLQREIERNLRRVKYLLTASLVTLTAAIVFLIVKLAVA